MHMNGIGPLLLHQMAKYLAIGECHILTHEREVHRYAIDFHTMYVLLAVHAIGSKAEDNVAVGCHALGQIHGNSLDAPQVGVIVFGDMEYSHWDSYELRVKKRYFSIVRR